jgi:hypothetical protein
MKLNRGCAGVGARALDPFPIPVRTLDALHLAIEFLRVRQQQVELESYDGRLVARDARSSYSAV